MQKKWLNVLSKRKSQGMVTLTEENRSIPGEDSFLLAEDNLVHEQRYQLLIEKLGELGDSCRELLRLSWSCKSMEEVAENFTTIEKTMSGGADSQQLGIAAYDAENFQLVQTIFRRCSAERSFI